MHAFNGLKVHQFACLSDNYGYLVCDDATGMVATIDTPDAAEILAEANAQGWTITHIFNTHWHPDHAGGNAEIVAKTGAKVYAPAEVVEKFGPVDVVLSGGESVQLGESQFDVLDVGGHTLGHIAFVGNGFAFVGDSIFALGCGRLFEGTAKQAYDSLERLMALPDETVVFCAHEYTQANARFCESLGTPSAALANRIVAIDKARAESRPTVPTTIGLERATSPFVLANEAGLRASFGMENASRMEVFAQVRHRKDIF